MSTQPSTNQGRIRQPGTYAAPALAFDLNAELGSLQAEKPWQAAHTAKTLVKHPDLRVVLVAIRAGGRLQQHETTARVSIQALSGDLRVYMPAHNVHLPAGHLLALDRDVPHEVVALDDSAFLLTIAWPDLAGSAVQPKPMPHRIASIAIGRPLAQSPQKRGNVIRIDARLSRERGLDRTLAETFPCSDALSTIPDPCLSGT